MLKPRKFRMDLAFKDLSLKLNGSDRMVLNGVTGQLHAGHLSAVMGPSGAGKTTFLSTLAGKVCSRAAA